MVDIDRNRSSKNLGRNILINSDIKQQHSEPSASIDNLKVNSEGEIEPIQGDFTLGGNKAAKVLTLAAGGDNQSHVTRPRTANVQNIKKQNNLLKRVNSQLETITENNIAEEDAVA